jgi:hypothetical protein
VTGLGEAAEFRDLILLAARPRHGTSPQNLAPGLIETNGPKLAGTQIGGLITADFDGRFALDGGDEDAAIGNDWR